MRRSRVYEIAAGLLAMFGAFAIVGSLAPILNPGLANVRGIEMHWFPIAFSMVVLCVAWRMNVKAQQLKRDGK